MTYKESVKFILSNTSIKDEDMLRSFAKKTLDCFKLRHTAKNIELSVRIYAKKLEYELFLEISKN